MNHPLQWKKFHPLSDQNAFICLVDIMGDDSSIVQAARVSYGKDEQTNSLVAEEFTKHFKEDLVNYYAEEPGSEVCIKEYADGTITRYIETEEERKIWRSLPLKIKQQQEKDRQLIRYLMNHSHTTPFEMVEIKFMVQLPMDCWRQWVRHRTANINEYSTRYTEALDMQQVTLPGEWRLQATDNKQGSSGFLENKDLGEMITAEEANQLIINMDEYFQGSRTDACHVLSHEESLFHKMARNLYELRLKFGIAKEQARKDLPLSTYTRLYWKCDLHNIFNFLRLRMDSHAQLEIRSFANNMFDIVKQLCPVACEAFEDYVLHAKKFSRMEIKMIKDALIYEDLKNDPSMTDREWKEFLQKLSC